MLILGSNIPLKVTSEVKDVPTFPPTYMAATNPWPSPIGTLLETTVLSRSISNICILHALERVTRMYALATHNLFGGVFG